MKGEEEVSGMVLNANLVYSLCFYLSGIRIVFPVGFLQR